MKLLFVHDHKFRKIGDNIFSPGGLSNEILSRYTEMFGEVVIAARILEETEVKKTYSKISNPLVTITNSNDLKSLVAEADCVIVRLPSIRGVKAEEHARRMKKPCLVEVVGCVWDAYWNYGIKGKIAAPIAYLIMRHEVWNSKYTLYVTQEFLQKRYPCRGLSIGVSDVELQELSSSVLEKRKAKIQNIDKKITIGTIAAIDVPYKGHEYVIKALKQIHDRTGYVISYQMVGSGSKDRLNQIARECGCENQVQFKGALPHEKVFEWLDSIDYYIQPSLQEGLCRSLVEAMSRGLPCAASKVGGNIELIGKECIFSMFRKGKIQDQIAEIVCSALKNQTLEKNAISNFEKARQYFNKMDLDKKREDFYSAFIKESKKECLK